MTNRIEVGDKVNVLFEVCACEFRVTIKRMPVATGDCWEFEREDGTPVLVQSYCKIEPVKEFKQ